MKDAVDAKEKLLRLKEATQALALSYKEQVELFPDFVLMTDELVLEYDEAYRFLEKLTEDNQITRSEAVLFESIDTYSQYLSDHFKEMFLNPESLETDPRWEKMRELAREALKRMKWPLEKPKFSNTTYVGRSK